VPAIKPLYDTRVHGDTLIEIGKRIKGPMGEYYRALDSTENVIRHLARGFEADPGDNGVSDFESWKEKGVWYKKPYIFRFLDGEFRKWDGEDYSIVMTEDEIEADLFKTDSGKFELRSGWLESNADWIAQKTGRDPRKLMFPHREEPVHPGGGDLHMVTPKVAMHAEGRGANLPVAIATLQPVLGGRKTVYIEINPQTARGSRILKTTLESRRADVSGCMRDRPKARHLFGTPNAIQYLRSAKRRRVWPISTRISRSSRNTCRPACGCAPRRPASSATWIRPTATSTR
jgi:hypothetical protein